ncbi:hypothetical protein RYH80_17355 [Halobaculum sp. MBLA0147]|uniref:hypothetical protein n=1 Tax=Halobaculum sp. MBLA0147 TaxID=3079934 RepID=UPI003525955B
MVSNLPVETERRGEYVIWNMREWDGDDEVLGDLEERWVEIHTDSSIEGSVVVLNDDLRLDSGFQEHIETR